MSFSLLESSLDYFRLDVILLLFLFMVEHHTYHIKNHILHKDTLKRAMLLVNSKYTSLSLSALRLLRKIIGKGDESYNSHLIKERESNLVDNLATVPATFIP